MKGELASMMARHARAGRLDWIGLRPERRAEVIIADTAILGEAGIEGDHARPGKRAVTLIQAEHLPVIAALTGAAVDPALLRRNLVVSGLNLAALRGGRIRIGAVVLQVEGPCPPCSRMEDALGHGGYNAVRGHGGWYASVVAGGEIRVGSDVSPEPDRD